MSIKTLSNGLILQKGLRSLRPLKGGTRIAKAVARMANRACYHGKWPAIDSRNLHYILDADSEIDWQLFFCGGFDNSLLSFLETILHPGDILVDVGANIGCISLPATTMVGTAGKVLAFEADPQIFYKLKVNNDQNALPSLECLNIALGAVEERKKFFRPPTSGMFSDAVGSLYPNQWLDGGFNFDVFVRPLDKVLHEKGITRIRCIKIDVEGGEMDVLRGSFNTLRSCHPVLCIEMCRHTYSAAGWTPKDLTDFLAPLGYVFKALDGKSGQLLPLESTPEYDFLNLVAAVP